MLLVDSKIQPVQKKMFVEKQKIACPHGMLLVPLEKKFYYVGSGFLFCWFSWLIFLGVFCNLLWCLYILEPLNSNGRRNLDGMSSICTFFFPRQSIDVSCF